MRSHWIGATVTAAILGLLVVLSGCGWVDYVTGGKPPIVSILQPSSGTTTTQEPSYTVLLAYDPWHFETCSVVHSAGIESATITHASGVEVFVVPLARGDNLVGAYCTLPDGGRVSSHANYRKIVRE